METRRLQRLIVEVLESNASRFYRTLYGTSRMRALGVRDARDLAALPVLTRAMLAATPLRDRLYRSERGITKTVRHDPPFLVHRTVCDIAEDDYALGPRKRPLVLSAESGDACERALWCYERGVIPLIGEPNNLPSTAAFARQYRIDAVIAETALWERFLPHLSGAYDVREIRRAVFAEPFSGNRSSVRALGVSPERIVFVLSLPETGPFARSCPRALLHRELVFHPDESSAVEIGETAILTKFLMMPTPLIRYDTGLAVRERNGRCRCGKPAFEVLDERGRGEF